MHVFEEIAPLRAHLTPLRSPARSLGFVPTMGALHEGHRSLIRASRKDNAVTVCSIYVNPTQFGNTDDLNNYPRTLREDLEYLRQESCDVVFCPSNKEMYSEGEGIGISFPGLDNTMEGEFRPGHFSGVGQIVTKLFNIVQPDRAYFGQKDFQQLMVVSRLVKAMKINVEIVSVPTVREADGLAMSSRNARLSADERKRATILYQGLKSAREALLKGRTCDEVIPEIRSLCQSHEVLLEYLALVDKHSFLPMDRLTDPSNAVLLIAARLGSVRLIDNLFINPDY